MIVGIFVAVIFILIVAAKSIKIVRPWQKGLIERLGKYQRTVDSGLTTLIPFIENIKLVDMREQVVDVPPQNVITEDNVAVEVDAVIYHEVTDPVKVSYNVADFFAATTKLAQTNLRNVIGDMSLDVSLTSRESINTKLRDILDEATDKWGTKITRVEIQRIEPPADVTESMHTQMKAERERRAMISIADGQREAAIRAAEGDKQAQILRAEGQAESVKKVAEAERFRQLTVAEGEAEAIQKVFSAIHEGRPTNDLLGIKYLEALKEIAQGQATKIFLPLDSSGIMGSIAGIAELFKEGSPKKRVITETSKSE
ncbi:SPFH/Band 7/PHB domain protein [Candidatus Aerophobetes bacterium]|nr:SPFH/Band 7/PHB domain protein [Candidatus Aerophobetes bacterium]